MDSSIEFAVFGRYALFTDPLTRVGGEKFSYPIPTYEALKGVAKSIYWKPTFVWHIDDLRVMKPIRTQSRGMKPLMFGGGNTLAIYTYLADVEYHVRAHFEWNEHRPEFADDRNPAKHIQILERSLERGGRQDVFLGTRDCQAYVEPRAFTSDIGAYDGAQSQSFGLMIHSFGYPDEIGRDELEVRLWEPIMTAGVIHFPRPEDCASRKFIRAMGAKAFAAPETPPTGDAHTGAVGNSS